ncbi:MAG: hypothetical protein IJC82_03085, partial [Firmicutes bacterium]|nr:hypothetical protein [Bacillota bacterium]
MIDLLSMDQKDMELFLSEHGFPKFRSKQLYQWIHEKEVFSFDEMKNLPKDLRSFLAEHSILKRGKKVAESVSSDKETIKFLLDFDICCFGILHKNVLCSHILIVFYVLVNLIIRDID